MLKLYNFIVYNLSISPKVINYTYGYRVQVIGNCHTNISLQVTLAISFGILDSIMMHLKPWEKDWRRWKKLV